MKWSDPKLTKINYIAQLRKNLVGKIEGNWPKLLELSQTKWSKMNQNGAKWSKVDQNGGIQLSKIN